MPVTTVGDISIITMTVGSSTNSYDVKDSALWSLFADEYSSTKAYAVGDLVIYNKSLYQCITAISGESWTSSHWTKTTIDSIFPTKISQLQNDSGFTTADVVEISSTKPTSPSCKIWVEV